MSLLNQLLTNIYIIQAQTKLSKSREIPVDCIKVPKLPGGFEC